MELFREWSYGTLTLIFVVINFFFKLNYLYPRRISLGPSVQLASILSVFLNIVFLMTVFCCESSEMQETFFLVSPHPLFHSPASCSFCLMHSCFPRTSHHHHSGCAFHLFLSWFPWLPMPCISFFVLFSHLPEACPSVVFKESVQDRLSLEPAFLKKMFLLIF